MTSKKALKGHFIKFYKKPLYFRVFMCYNTNEKFSRRKFMKRIIATLIAVMLLFSVFSAINVSADIGYGNIDKKDGVTVSDALLALQASVKMLELDEEQLNLASKRRNRSHRKKCSSHTSVCRRFAHRVPA